MTTWMTEAKKHVGLREIKGKETNITIKSWLSSLRSWWNDDETPWCGTFVAHCIKSANLPLVKHWYRAKDWLNWGVALTEPCYGCIVVFDRVGGGHVGFVVGIDYLDRLMVLGGNQGDAVSIVAFEKSRVAGYRMWSHTGTRKPLPKIMNTAKSSINEA